MLNISWTSTVNHRF